MKIACVTALAAVAASCGLASTAAAADLPLGVKLYGLNYDRRKGVDWAPVKCKTRDEVFADMEKIATLSERVRLYGMGKDGCATADVLDAAKGKLKVALGVWPENDGNFAYELAILEDLARSGRLDDNIDGIHVGSEAIYRKDYSVDKAIDYLNQVRAMLKRYGKTDIKLTIADVVDSYYQYPQLLDAVDEVSINQFTFWEKKGANEGALIMLDRIRSIRRQAAAKGKNLLISETGWASAGKDEAASEASVANQRNFFINFYQQATAQQLPYFWFAAFDNLWMKENPQLKEVERYFGVMNFDRTLKESFANIKDQLSPRTRTTFKSPASGRYLAETFNPDRMEEVTGVEMIAESSDKLTALRYQWFYDAAKGQVRSLNSDRCLDAYEPWNGGTVHTYMCIDTENNQKWKYDATTKQLKHAVHTGFCLDNDPTQNYKLQLWGCSDNNANQQYETDIVAAESNGVRFIAKESKDPSAVVQLVRSGDSVKVATGAQTIAGSEWLYDSATNLVRSKDSEYCLDAYEAWDGGRVHVWQCSQTEQNQRWSFDSATGQLKHLKHKGFCLDNDQANGVIQLWGCHLNNNNQVWRMVSGSAKAVKITNTDKSVLEFVSRDQQLFTGATAKDAQVWFYNSYKNTIVSKWSGECLDADQPYDGGRVHTWDCIATEGNQKWTFENGLVKHATHKGLCLAQKNAADRSLVLKTCSSSDATQSLTLPSA